MKKISTFLLCLLLTVHFSPGTIAQVKSPREFFGFEPGTDRELFNYEQLISYLQKLDDTSGMVKMIEIGRSPMDKPMYICFISSEENINRLDELKEINRKLALDPDLTDEEQLQLIRNGKVFFLATLSMHSSEVGPSQSAPAIAYELMTNDQLPMTNWLDNVVFMMVPCHNPDGMDMIVDHYNKYKGTKFEGSSMPGVYHKYIGHDNNRDFVTLSQSDTRAIAAIYNKDWFPQVMVEKHQMSSAGVRYFVPPPHDPIAENIDAGIWNWIGVFGSGMMKDMTRQGQKGIAQRYLFDDYWPGSTETCLWKNVIGMLTEGASADLATPIYIEPNELAVYGKGLSEYEKSINMPELWPGGWWRLSDLVAYEKSSTYSIIKTAAEHKEDILKFRNDLCRKEVQKGLTEAPYYYLIPKKQRDPGEMVRLVNLLMEHGVKVFENDNLTKIIDDIAIFPGDLVVPLAQPFRAFIKEILEKQVYPLRHYTPNGEIIKPYDITSWSLPLHNGIDVKEISLNDPDLPAALKPLSGEYNLKKGLMTEFWGMALPVERNESFKAAFYAISLGLPVERMTSPMVYQGVTLNPGSFIISGLGGKDKPGLLYKEMNADPVFLAERPDCKAEKLVLPRIALIETNMHDMDAGWTRFLFDTYHLSYTIVKPGDFEKTDFTANFDVIVFPSTSKDILKEGKNKGEGDDYYLSRYPPEFTKGMGEKGFERLLKFLDEGGLIISWGASTDLFSGILKIKRSETETEEFQLPYANLSKKLEGLYVPGSFVKMELKADHPVTLGMPAETGVFYRGNPVFTTSMPGFDTDRRVIGKFPEKDILLSGYIEKEELLRDKSCLVWMKKGKGQLVLFAFNPQFRASTAANYKLLFNSLLLKDL